MLVVKVEPGHCEVRLGSNRLFLDGAGLSILVEADHSVSLRVGNTIYKNRGACGPRDRVGEQDWQAVPVEDIVAENQRRRTTLYELRADDESLRQTFGLRLNRI